MFNLLLRSDGVPVPLENMFLGRSCFLICGGPSFSKIDSSLLHSPGILTMAVNNSVKSFRPNMWTCVDTPENFLKSIWMDPTIMKFAPHEHLRAKVLDSNQWNWTGRGVSEMPNTFFYVRHLGKWNASTCMNAPSVYWGTEDHEGGRRSVMHAAIRLLFWLGIRRIFLLGADFKMTEKETYHFEQSRTKDSVSGNTATYAVLNKRFTEMRPHTEAKGLKIFNCNPSSALTAFEFVKYEDAIAVVSSELGVVDIRAERTEGLYSEKKPGWTPPKGQKFIFKPPSFLGDQIAFTGALKAIHTAYPDTFITDIARAAGSEPGQQHQGRSAIDELMSEHPLVTTLPRVPSIRAFLHDGCPNFRQNIGGTKHVIQLYAENLAQKLDVPIGVVKCCGDVFVTDAEKLNPGFGLTSKSYWLMIAGAKTEVPTKNWGVERYQKVVDALQGKVQFVQVGERRDWHPPLRGVLDLVGKTSVRDLVRLAYHARGAICPITSLMHLMAAIPDGPRPCVILAGGRERPSYIQYPNHEIMHTIGKLSCCQTPCMKNRCERGNECMSLLTPELVYNIVVKQDARIQR